MKKNLGILALQGAFARHIHIFRQLGHRTTEIREPGNLSGIDGLILPGGESTTMSRMLVRWELIEPLRECINDGMPVMGTCAGLILLANRLEENWDKLPRPGGLNIVVTRNAYGRQINSFETSLELLFDTVPFNGIFIRAPQIDSMGSNVKVLSLFEGKPVMVQQDNILGCGFHPELSGDDRIHQFFVQELCI